MKTTETTEHRWAGVRRDGEAAIDAINEVMSRWVISPYRADNADALAAAWALDGARDALRRLLPATWILDGNALVLGAEDDKPVETPSPSPEAPL